MKTFQLNGQAYIQLNQLMKVLSLASSGGEANMLIENGLVKVNDKVEKRKRNKIKPNDIVTFNQEKIKIEA